MKIFLHIGYGKCASSTIQSFFSYNHTQKGFAYACINKTGTIDIGDKLKEQAIDSSHNYQSSILLRQVTIDDSFINNLTLGLKALSEDYDTVLFSKESWSHCYEEFALLSNIFSEYDVEVIMVVRPPVLWANSAWWQWGNWSDLDEESYLQNNMPKKWLTNIRNFKKLDFVDKVHVLSLNNNIMKDIFSIVGFDDEGAAVESSNLSSSQELLSFMSHNRRLRVGMHTPGKESVLNKYLKPRSKANWILSKHNVEYILKSTKEDVLELSRVISNEDITKNKAWWESSFYDDKKMNRSNDLSKEVLNDMLLESYSLILGFHRRSKDVKNNNSEKHRPTAYYLRDEALKIENKDIAKAYDLMKHANILYPIGPFIEQKLADYKKILDKKSLYKKT